MDADAIGHPPRCRIIARYELGVDNIDLRATRAADIAVTNVTDYCVDEVAAHTVAMLLSLLRKPPTAHGATRAGQWGVPSTRPMRRPDRLAVGLVGYGRIGRREIETAATKSPVAPPKLKHTSVRWRRKKPYHV